MLWTGAVSVALAVVGGGGAALLEKSAHAQASRPQVPLFDPDPLWSQALPNRWVTGQVGGVAVDSHDNVWVFHRKSTIPDGEKAASLTPPQADAHSGARGAGIRAERHVSPGVGGARSRI